MSESHNAMRDRIRSSTDPALNARIDIEARSRIDAAFEAGRAAMSERLQDLDREWDVERYLMTNAGALSLIGVLLAARVDRKWLVLPGVVGAFLLQHALQGWCPPLVVFRKMGIRSRKEIDAEKYALKALRGDFETANSPASAFAAAEME